MAAHVQSIWVCPKCQEGLTGVTRPKQCPSCKQPFGPSVQAGYTIPYSLTGQFNKRTGVDVVNAEECVRFAAFIAQIPTENAQDILNDALSIVESLAGKKADVSEISGLIVISKRIGEIATAYHNYLMAGGKHNHSMMTVPKPEPSPTIKGAVDVSYSARTVVREDPPASES